MILGYRGEKELSINSRMKAFISWSGGKDGVLAYYRTAQQYPEVCISYLLNMTSEDGRHSRSHGISSKLLKAQAEAIGVPIVQKKTTWEDYEKAFKQVVSTFKKEGIEAGIFGDIDLQEHRDWVERVCKDLDIKPILPLWKEEREKLVKEFIQLGFKAIIVATNSKFLDDKWLGRQINEKFIHDLKALGNIDLCGESGEYHTLVYDGPIFKRGLKFKIGEKILKNGHWFLEIKMVDL